MNTLTAARKSQWAIAVLLAIAAVMWVVARIYPDQVYSAYLQTRRWMAAAGPMAKLPVPPSKPRAKSGGFVVIDSDKALGVVAEGGTWHPSMLDIYRVEASLPQISRLKAENWPASSDIRIDHPDQYFRQYVGVIQKGKKLIYINAFCDDIPVSYWRARLVVIMDGGTCCWQAFYDPTTSNFTMLRINGLA